MILLDTPQNPTQLTLMAVNRNHADKHQEKAKPQLQTCFRDSTGTGTGAEPHRHAQGGKREQGNSVTPSARKHIFPLLTALLHLLCSPSAIPSCQRHQSPCAGLRAVRKALTAATSAPQKATFSLALPQTNQHPLPTPTSAPALRLRAETFVATPPSSSSQQSRTGSSVWKGLEAFEMPSDPPSPKRI